MKQSFKIWFKLIPDGWKFFGAITGFAGFVWIAAITFDHWKDKGINQQNVIEYLKQENATNKKLNRIRDSIETKRHEKLNTHLDHISDSLGHLFKNTQTLTNAVGTIGSKVTRTVPDLFKLMGGLQFEMVEEFPSKSIYPDRSVKIIKIDTSKIK
jgi:hypothetical protein